MAEAEDPQHLLSDSDSPMSEIDDRDLEDYNYETARLETRPVDIDDVVRTLKPAKKRNATGANLRSRRGRASKRSDAAVEGGAEGSDAAPQHPALQAMEHAIKASAPRRGKRNDVALEIALDDELAELRAGMELACQSDLEARKNGEPATHKLHLLPKVVAMLSRENAYNAVVDPEGNFLQAVKFFLEPLNDASLPAYNIQRGILSCLLNMRLEKESLIQSGLGKIVLHYTKSRQPQPDVRRMAEKLLEEWSRPMLKGNNAGGNAASISAAAPPPPRRSDGVMPQQQLAAKANASSAVLEQLAMPLPGAPPPPSAQFRGPRGGLPAVYTIAPKSTIDPAVAPNRPKISGREVVRKIGQKKRR